MSENKEVSPKSDFLRIEARPDAEWIIIAFSHLNYPAGKFAMSNELRDVPTSKIFVNCKSNAWYQEGIDIAPSIDTTADLLREQVRQLGSKTILYPLLKAYPKLKDRASLCYWFAIVCFDMKLFVEAKISLQRGLQMGAKNFEIFHLLGMVLAAQDQHEEAIKSHLMATELQSKAHMSFFRAEKSWEQLGHNADAVVSYQRVLDIVPAHAEAAIHLRAAQDNRLY